MMTLVPGVTRPGGSVTVEPSASGVVWKPSLQATRGELDAFATTLVIRTVSGETGKGDRIVELAEKMSAISALLMEVACAAVEGTAGMKRSRPAKWMTRFNPVRMLYDSTGLAAVEFALIVPLMLLFYLGSFEATNMLTANRRVTAVAYTCSLNCSAEFRRKARCGTQRLQRQGARRPQDLTDR